MPRPCALDRILRLRPERDHQRVCYLSVCVELLWDTNRSLELTLFRTYSVPRMTEIMVRTVSSRTTPRSATTTRC